jgi:putative hemolysin
MSTGLSLVLVGTACVLAAGSALFSAFETALFAFQGHELERLRRHKARQAERLSRVLSNPRRLLGVLSLGYVCFNVPLVLICLFLTRRGRLPVLSFWGSEMVLLALVVVACDLLPKALALRRPYRFVRLAAGVLDPLLYVLQRPLGWVQRLSDVLAERLLPGSPGEAKSMDQSQMETLIEIGAEDGALQPVERAIIQQIIHLGDKRVRDCMTPRVDALCVPDSLSRAELAVRLGAARYRRVPVYGETPDDILGVLDVRAYLEAGSAHYTEMLTPPSFVPETMRAVDLLRSFLNRPQALAIVLDEHGGTEGVITRSDLLEEILGEALPGGDRELYLEALGPGCLLASGSARIEDVAEHLGVELKTEGIDTIGGLVFNLSGTLPRLGSVWTFGELTITVRRTSRKRVEEVLVQTAAAVEEAGRGPISP